MTSRHTRRTTRSGASRITLSVLTTLALTASACGVPDPSGDREATGTDHILNCDIEVPVSEPPERIFAAYQPAIEMAHALGVSDRLVGTAYLDAEVLDEYTQAQQGQRYYETLPSREEVLSTEPDFVLSGFNGAFTDENFGTRASLREIGIESWIFSPLCPSEDGAGDETIDPSTVTIEAVYEDLRDLGAVFGTEDAAEDVIADMRKTIGEVAETLDAAGDDLRRPSVMIGRPDADGFRIAAGPDFSSEILSHAGGRNAFADLDSKRNVDISTEELIDRDPEHIFVDVCCAAGMTPEDSADDVEAILSNPALANVTAVAEGNVHEFTFANRSAGVRSATVIAEIAGTIHPELFE
ncbi:ABC transporter substrate-binding protein [Haloechinothrix aidingensis]|uniref:ABC transporter substrate-binding protein n=1 Tax=Haloechinothrix aidingensis TaxID=2752311 RepID=UPI001FE324A9|nr:ABC transporter substrate-binding protein [Haloechinothrix aidingensis]